MTPYDVLACLKTKNVSVHVNGDEMIIRAPKDFIDADLKAAIAQNKTAILEILRVQPDFFQKQSDFGSQQNVITPDMLPLIDLNQSQIDHIVAAIPQGKANVQDMYPLSPLQEGILFHHLLETVGDKYVLRMAIAFDSRSRLDKFLAALQQVIDRHDILRTAIFWHELPQAVQVVQRTARLPITELTLSPNNDAVAQLMSHTDPRRLRLNLQRAPLLVAHVAADPHSNEWLLSLAHHHIAIDHITLDLILNEVQIILEGEQEKLGQPLHYRDFIAQSRAVPEAVHEAYFCAQLGDIAEPTAPFGILDAHGDSGPMQDERIVLSDELAQSIREGARKNAVSPAVLFHVAYASVLAQCTARDDVVFGTVLSGRLQGADGVDQ